MSFSVVEQVEARAVAGGWCRRPTKVLAYNNFDRTTSSVLLSIFSSDGTEPAVVAKLCAKVEHLAREFENLRAVRRAVPEVAPLPLFLDRVGGYGVLGMKAVHGGGVSGWAECRDRLPAVVDLLVRVHGALREMDGREDGLRRSVEDALQCLAGHKQDLRTWAAAARVSEEVMAAVEKGRLPLIPQHGDFYLRNILFRGREVFVIDWEDFGEVCVPGYDLFSLFLDFFVPWKAGGTDRFFGDARLAEVLRTATRAYFKALEVPLDLAGALLGFTVIRRFTYSEQMGRSASGRLRQRVQGYFENGERFARMVAGL